MPPPPDHFKLVESGHFLCVSRRSAKRFSVLGPLKTVSQPASPLAAGLRCLTALAEGLTKLLFDYFQTSELFVRPATPRASQLSADGILELVYETDAHEPDPEYSLPLCVAICPSVRSAPCYKQLLFGLNFYLSSQLSVSPARLVTDMSSLCCAVSLVTVAGGPLIPKM